MVRRLAGGLVLLACPVLLGACYAVTEPATHVGSWSAVLNASGHTDSSPAHFYFEYATAKSDLGTPQGRRTPTRQIPANVSGPASEKVSDLDPGTTYWFRACGGDSQTAHDVCWAERSFTTQPGVAGLRVSVGYANDEDQYPSTEGFPADWGTGSGTTGSVTFLGDPYFIRGFGIYLWDSGGVRLDNAGDQPIGLDKVVVGIGARRYNVNDELWPPAQLVVPAHGTLILASAGGKDFDTSDALGLEVGCHGPPYPPTPQIEVTRAGVTTTFYDTVRLIPAPTTRFGVLSFDCGTENHPWQRVDVVK